VRVPFKQPQPGLPGDVEGLLRGGHRGLIITEAGLALGHPAECDCLALPVAGLGRELKRLLMAPERRRQVPVTVDVTC
jgi:hypothetical protein